MLRTHVPTIINIIFVLCFTLGCSSPSIPTLAPTLTEQNAVIITPSQPSQVVITPTKVIATSSPTATSTAITNWQDLPIVPTLSSKALEIYSYGQSLGNNPNRFTKIGDGEISAEWFLTIYDLDPSYYNLGEYSHLSQTIEFFAGSYQHQSQAAKRGYNTTKILDPKEADKTICLQSETPLDCEIRIYQPSFAVISMGTNQVWQPESYEQGLRIILNTLTSKGVVPILSTKADNLEGDHRINKIIAKLAAEYQLPVWNFWKACQSLPNLGLQKDLEHLTYSGNNNFGDPQAMTFAWPNRNLTALLTLESMHKQINP